MLSFSYLSLPDREIGFDHGQCPATNTVPDKFKADPFPLDLKAIKRSFFKHFF
jgi:hypothetical protein